MTKDNSTFQNNFENIATESLTNHRNNPFKENAPKAPKASQNSGVNLPMIYIQDSRNSQLVETPIEIE
jgi:hypothetical protein